MLLNTYSKAAGNSNVSPGIADKRRKSSVFPLSPGGHGKLDHQETDNSHARFNVSTVKVEALLNLDDQTKAQLTNIK